MAVFCITEVRLEHGEPVAVCMGQVDGSTNTWKTQPAQALASTAADRILAGDDVYLLFPVTGGHVLGPKLKAKTMPGGIETVEVDGEPTIGRSLQDMPTF